MLTVYQFPRAKHEPSLSPYCLKLETYLRLADIPHENKFTIALKKAPKGKLPYIELEGKKIADSTFIIQKLAAMNPQWDLDQNLTKEQKALATAVQRMSEDSLMIIGWHFRQADASGWQDFSKIIFRGAPALIRVLIGGQIHKSAKKLSHKFGIGRHTHEEILQIADRDLKSISDLMGNKKFFFGDSPTTIDCTLFGVLFQILESGQPKILKDRSRKYSNLVEYVKRMRAEYERAG